MDEPRPAFPIQIEPADWAAVVAILQARVPDREVWAFGSRSTGRAKRYSDLDLAFAGSQPLSLDLRAQLVEDFENSDLPFRVDVVDLLTAEPRFGERVRRSGVLVQKRGIPVSQ